MSGLIPLLPRFFASLRGRLMLVTIALLLPGLLLMSWMIGRAYLDHRRALSEQLQAKAQSLSGQIDAFIEMRLDRLTILATSPAFAERDLPTLYAQAQQVVPGKTEWLVLVDAQGKFLLHTEHPLGATLPDGAGPYLSAIAAGETYVSNLLLRGPATGRSVLFAGIPVRVGGQPGYSLHYVATAGTVSRILERADLPAGSVAALMDREDRVAGRNRRIEDFVGQLAPAQYRAFRIGRSHGTFEDTSLEGVASFGAMHTSPVTGWTVIVAMPKETLFASAKQMLIAAIIGLVVSVAVTLALAAWLSAGLIAAVRALVRGTEALSQGDGSSLRETGMTETDHVVRALRDAAHVLRSREAELARSRDEALEASRIKDEFLATLSHELRTPLNPVLLQAADGAEDGRFPPEARAAFAAIAKHVALEARLIDDMLDLTRVARGKLTLDRRVLELHEVLRDALATVELDFSEKRIELKATWTSPVLVSADPVRLQQVFWNIFKNAAKFTPVGGRVEITVRQTAADQVEVAVRDSGIGMTGEELARSFHAFEQGGHRLGGLGLGLSISRALVQLHGGTIEATSAGRDQGATVTVRLPVTDQPAPARLPDAPRGAGAAARAASYRILLVEDHEPSRVVLARLLSRRGHHVVGAASVTEALARFREQEFDLLVSDIGLPDGDGYALFEQLKQMRALVGIAVTGYGMESDVARASTAGFVAHLVKPVTVETLSAAMERAHGLINPSPPAGPR